MRTLSLLLFAVLVALFLVPDQADAARPPQARRGPPRPARVSKTVVNKVVNKTIINNPTPVQAVSIGHGFAVHAADLRTLRVRRGLDFDPALHYGYRVGLSTYRTPVTLLAADPGDPCNYQPPAPVAGVIRVAVQAPLAAQAPAPPVAAADPTPVLTPAASKTVNVTVTQP